ncbi:cation-translocating P-type ATPase [Chitinophaga niabensis]|uniref:Ca2+-transporting ATPase n=1 Tax=Chitinophaga niabensis TaxID=536979 RepID=A0A1N6DQ65_9BACT|nr:cation-translocating P-type ATPase [Chitinophaga niabensis]SIN72935.1 Ca2+-transporting ATPase [Chitinophaga niabensis]
MGINWHTITAEETLRQTGSSIQGLNDNAVRQKLEEFGKNELQTKKKVHPVLLFFRQFFEVMILVLVVAAVISAFIGEVSDTFVIIVIIILNAVVGFIQEYRAEKAMDALRKMAAPTSTLIRNGSTIRLPSIELLPGDIVLLEVGNMVPADIRLLESHSLKINEASLTGESNAIDKTTDPLQDASLPLGDRSNMAFNGTLVTNGRGKGVVVATAMQTELGKIAGMLEDAKSSSPLQKRMEDFSRKLTFIILGLCAVLFFIGFLRGEDLQRMLLTVISLAVAAIPEALPAVVTVSLALGAKRLLKKNVLIRKLYAVETLGSVTYICTDKTGTLTRNKMRVQEVWENGPLLLAMSLNHDVKEKEGELFGDPTEIAMVEYAKEQERFERVKEIPFDADRKAMTTIFEKEGKYWVITKGATESIADMMADAAKEELKTREEEMAKKGMRVIGFATKELDELPSEITPEQIEKDLEFIGLVGLIDPPRQEAKDAILQCKEAGIAVVMITGDHPLTAGSIAQQLEIIGEEEGKIITGKELEAMPEEVFREKVEQLRVYARVSPQQKLNIVTALQENHQFVSMTGDGVNDAPSLKKANIGVAMGITGTDVTKEAAHMILVDDNFATIVDAVGEGRRIYDNIRKFIRYILTGNSAEIWCLFLAPLLGLPIPLLPVHILWVNLVTDGLPALALSTEIPEKNIMQRPPRRTDESIFAKGLGIHVLWVGVFIGLLTVGMQWYAIHNDGNHWQTMVFTTLCFCQLYHVMAIRSETRSLFSMGLWSNRPLLLAVGVTVLLQLMVIYVPYFNELFHTAPLSWQELLIVTGVSGVVFVAVEIEKWVKRKAVTI